MDVNVFDLLMDLALEAAELDDCAAVMRLVVERLSQQPTIALVRIWRLKPGDICHDCPQAAACPAAGHPGTQDCLHLVASAGSSRARPDEDWGRLDGRFRRFPLGWRKIGKIALSAEPITIRRLDGAGSGFADPAWVDREQIVGFTGHPLLHRGRVLGVLGIFTRSDPDPEKVRFVRLFARLIAVAIANAEALGTITDLRDQLALERDYLLEERSSEQHAGGIIGDSSAMQTVKRQVAMVAETDATVLIVGESGTGKELVASAIHAQSPRADKPMVRVNCAAMAPELFESEFFGHVTGAFTGALSERAGRFQIADGGTLFLDEIGELPLGLQSKLLRVLQEGSYERVGEDLTRHCDVRVIAATNRDLLAEAEAGRFRRDLYYRLSVFPVTLPPLRDRREDIPDLARFFLGSACARLNHSGIKCRLTRGDLVALQGYGWPGNIRELQHVIERGVILAEQGRVRLAIDAPPPTGQEPAASAPPTDRILTDRDWDELQRRNLLAALERCQGVIYGPGGAATLLGIKPTTLLYRLKKYNIRREWTAG